MGLIDRFKGLFSAKSDLGTFNAVTVDSITPSSFRTAPALLKAYNASPWLRAVVAHVAQRVSSVEITLHRAVDEKAAAALKRKSYTQRLKTIKEAPEAFEQVESHILLDLLDNGNPLLTGMQCRMLTHSYLDLLGNALWVIERNLAGLPVEIWPAPTTWVKKLPSRDNGLKWELNWMNIETRKIPAKDVVWFRVPDPEVPYGFGTGLAQVLADELDSDEYAAKMIKAAFYNRGQVDFVMTVEGASPAELQRAKHSFEAKHRGVERAGSSFWHSGKHKLDKVTQSFEELQVIKLREFERDFIISVFRVPPETMGLIENSNRATITEASTLLADNVIIPRLTNELSTVQRSVIDPLDKTLTVGYVDPRPNDKDLELAYTTAKPDTLTVNEWRSRQGLEAIEGGDEPPRALSPVSVPPSFGSNDDDDDDDDEGSDEGDEGDDGDDGESKTYTYVYERKATMTEVDAALAAIEPDLMVQFLAPLWEEETLRIATAALASVNFQGAFDLVNPLVEEHVREFSSTRITDITDTTKERVRSTLAEGIGAGEGADSLAKRVREEMGGETWKNRSKTIARTETGRSSNFATHAAYEVAGIERKEWIATLDSRVRDSHRNLDGEKVGVNEPFVSGDIATMYPGESGVPAFDINCRCTITADIDEASYTDEERKERRAEIWKRFDADAEGFEERSMPQWDAGIKAQRDAFLKVLGI